MSSSLALLPLLLAVQLPPHGRVNYRCYPVWNERRDNLDLVWNGEKYQQPWVFNKEVDLYGCTEDTCVQRLWCADSGAVGRYTEDTRQRYSGQNEVLAYTWLLNTSLRGQRVLAVRGHEGDATVMEHTSPYGQGTLLVMGSTLYFYTYSRGTHFYGLPRLTSLVFAEYQAGRPAEELVTQALTAFNVLGYTSAYYWFSYWSPLYPAGSDALTVSVAEDRDGSVWGIDVSLALSSSAARRAMVHSLRNDTLSLRSASREVLTVPGYTCRAFTNGTAPKCYRIGESATKYTWASTEQTVLGWTFSPLGALPSFALPGTLWLHDVRTHYSEYRVLATWGLGSIVAFAGSTFYGVELRAQAGCSSGSGLFLASYDVSGDEPVQRTLSASLGCANAQSLPASNMYEVAYAATAVKWLGPFADECVLFAAADLASHEYSLHSVRVRSCPPGHYRGTDGCQPCPVGFFCPGTLDGTDEKRPCPRCSSADKQGMAKCAVSAGFFFRYPGSVELCTSGHYCPGGLSEPQECPASRPRCDGGCRSEAQCRA